MSLLNHPNVVKILCSFVERQELWIIMPLLQAGSCAAIMKQVAPKGFKDDALLATILYNTLCGLAYLHKDGRIHRDVKAGNILIGGQGDVQLADFGVAGTLMENGDRKKHRQTFTGTPCWMAPEVMEQASGYDEKADIWSFGITALELAYGYAPYARYQPMKVMLLTLQEEPPTAELYGDKSHTFNKHFHSLVGKCLKRDASKRPSARKLMEHKLFKLVAGKEYVRDAIVKQLPRQPKKSMQPIDLMKTRRRDANAVNSSPTADGGSETAGVNVGSWVFDPEEFSTMKRAIEQEEARDGKRRPESILEQREPDEQDDDDYRTSPVHSPNLSPTHTALQPPSSALPPAMSTPPASSSAFLAPSSGSAASTLPLPVPNPRKQSHGRFVVTDTYLNTTAAPAANSSSFFTSSTPTPVSTSVLPYPTSDSSSLHSSPQQSSFFPSSAPSQSSPLDVFAGLPPNTSVSSAYNAMLASGSGAVGGAGGSTPTISHSRVGRFAVTDEVQHQ